MGVDTVAVWGKFSVNPRQKRELECITPNVGSDYLTKAGTWGIAR